MPLPNPLKQQPYLWILAASLAFSALACLGSSQVDEPTATPAQEAVTPSVEPEFPAAEIVNDEGGPVVVTGEVAYTNPFFTTAVAQPIVILEDQGGFVVRDRGFTFPPESQVLGQITSDFYTSPFSYSLTLPQEPQGTQRDVDQDGESDAGVQVFAVAYWTNTWGDPYLERRDQGGGGWSSAYASTRVSDDQATYLEIVGGKLLIYSGEAGQGFPGAFGDDGLLFTQDDPIVGVPQGWTLVDLDSDPFVFDRSRQPTVDLLEPESSALDDFSELSYTEAFDAMLAKFRTEYAFTEHKGLDWDALEAEVRPRFEQAERLRNQQAYALALRDFLWSIPDGHVNLDITLLLDQFRNEVSGGLGLAIAQLEDGGIVARFVLEEGPAQQAGIQFGAEILEIQGVPAADYVADVVPWSSPFSTQHNRRLEQLRFATRFPIGTQVEIAFQNPDGQPQTATLEAVFEIDSYLFEIQGGDLTGTELPVEFSLLDSTVGYVQILDFFDNELLTIQLWERMMGDLTELGIEGLIIDLRLNGGGSGYLARQMAAYFFDEELVTGNTGRYDESTGEFYIDPTEQAEMIPPPPELRYHGPVVMILGPNCASACEFFAYAMTLQERARSVGLYPTAGLGGSVEDFNMPEGVTVRMTIGRAVDPQGEIHIEGQGVVPEVLIPLDGTNFRAIYGDGIDLELRQAVFMLTGSLGSGMNLSR